MNSEYTPTSRFRALCEEARAQGTPPRLWPAIAARAPSRSVTRPWLAAASLVAGAVAYLSAAHHLRSPSRSETDLAPIVSAAVPDAVRFLPEPLPGEATLLRHLSAASSRRTR